jgi:hypothetical protein
LFHAEGQTAITRVTATFRNFANSPNSVTKLQYFDLRIQPAFANIRNIPPSLKPNIISNANNVIYGQPRDPSLLSSLLRPGQSGIRVPARARDFPFTKTVQSGSGARAAFCVMRSRVLIPGMKQPGCEVDHLLPFVAKVTNKRRRISVTAVYSVIQKDGLNFVSLYFKIRIHLFESPCICVVDRNSLSLYNIITSNSNN